MLGRTDGKTAELHHRFLQPLASGDRMTGGSLKSCWRMLLALFLLLTGSGLLLWQSLLPAVTSAAPQRPVPVPVPHVAMAMAKKRRLTMPRVARVQFPRPLEAGLPPQLDMIERLGDGSFENYTYYKASLDLNAPDDPEDESSAGPVSAYQDNGAARNTPFSLVLNNGRVQGGQENQPGPVHANTRSVKAAEPAPVRVASVPVNVSVSQESPAPAVRRLVSLPLQEEPLRTVAGAVSVAPQDFDALEKTLGTGSIKAGESLEVIASGADTASGPPHIVMARLMTINGNARLIVRGDDGHFEDIASSTLYDRLVAEAFATPKSGPETAPPSPVTTAALQKAEARFPHFKAKLAKARVPEGVQPQIAGLLTEGPLAGKDLPKLDLVYRKSVDGRCELVSAAFDTGSGVKKFYSYQQSPDAVTEFFDEDGHSVSKSLMPKPVEAGRRGDGFGWRVHPILKVRKFHNGVDYAAPRGSPILAAGDGVVETISWEPGYGKYVRIRHDDGYSTTYAHIDGTPKGLKLNQRVSQGQVIAYVGSTGLSTGPHLYYELRIGDHYADPTRTRLPAGSNLTGRALAAFQQQIGHVEQIADFLKNGVMDIGKRFERKG